MFTNRTEAGQQLAEQLLSLKNAQPVVLALPRGGVPVAFEVAKALDAPLDLALVRKIGAPGNEEFGIGAVCDGAEPVILLDQEIVRLLGVPARYIEAETRREFAEIERRRRLWLGERPRPAIAGRTAIVIDDGVATGGTMRAALRSLRRQQPRQLVMAVPVAATASLRELAPEADQIVCLATPEPFYAIGQFYEDFHQLADSEVTEMLKQAESFGRHATSRKQKPDEA